VVFLQTFFAGLCRLVLGQTTSGTDAKCGDHFLHADQGEQSLQRRSCQSQHRRLHVPMHSMWATRRHAVAAALAPRLKGLNITTELMQVGKVVTGQQSYHHGQGLRASLIVLSTALQVLG